MSVVEKPVDTWNPSLQNLKKTSKNERNHFRCKLLMKRFEGETAVSLKHLTELKYITHWTEFEVHLTEKRD